MTQSKRVSERESREETLMCEPLVGSASVEGEPCPGMDEGIGSLLEVDDSVILDMGLENEEDIDNLREG